MTDKYQSESFQSEAPSNKTQKSGLSAKDNHPCSICRANGVPPPCRGHGGSGGGGGGSNDSQESSLPSKNSVSGNQIHVHTQGSFVPVGYVPDMQTQGTDLFEQPELDHFANENFNPEVISDLLSKRILFIDNNRNSGILFIKLQCTPILLPEEQRNELNKFAEVILKELNEFIKEEGISHNCVTIDKDKEGNFLSLRINLPTPTVYDSFIQRLADKNLLPQQNITAHETKKTVYPEGTNHFNPSPLSTKLTCTARNKNRKNEVEEQQNQSRKENPFRPRSPLDGPKPKGA